MTNPKASKSDAPKADKQADRIDAIIAVLKANGFSLPKGLE